MVSLPHRSNKSRRCASPAYHFLNISIKGNAGAKLSGGILKEARADKAGPYERQMAVQGEHEVDTWMYTGIFTACAAYNSPELRMVMSQAYQSMEAQWQRLQAGGPSTVVSKRWSLPAHSLSHGERGERWDLTFEADKVICKREYNYQKGSVKATTTSSLWVNHLGSSCHGNSDLRSVCRGWIVAYNSLLNGCAKSGVMAAAEEVMKGMQEEGPSPDVTSYNTLISGYAKVGLLSVPCPLLTSGSCVHCVSNNSVNEGYTASLKGVHPSMLITGGSDFELSSPQDYVEVAADLSC